MRKRALRWLPIVGSVTLMVMVACVSALSLAKLRQSIYWRKHTYEVLLSSQALYSGLIDTQRGMRGFVLTGHPSALATYRRGVRELPRELRELATLTRDNPVQQSRIERLERDVEGVTDYARRLMDARSRSGLQGVIELEATGEGLTAIDRVETELDAFTAEEHQLLIEREARTQDDFRTTTTLLIIGSALAAGLLVLAHLIGTREVNRRRRTEAKLAEVTILQQAILDSADYAIVSTDVRGTVTSMNATAERWFGYRADEVIGKTTPKLWHDEREIQARAAALSHELGSPVEPGFDVFTAKIRPGYKDESEWTLRRKDGSTFPGILSATALIEPHGEVVGYLGVVSDITERKQREAQLDRLKREFISTVSHELRTPLTSIRGSLGLIAGGALGALPEKAQGLVHIAHQNSERLVRIINDILDIEKVESGKLELQIGPVALGTLLRDALEINTPYGEKYQVRFVLESVPPEVQVRADPDRLMQVMANLLSNAAKFSPPGSIVRVCASAAGATVRVEVQDSGMGIPEEFHSRIFQKFAQADSSSARRFEGTGLGLSITRRLVEAMDGSIGFTTETGRGTTFYFDLPASNPATAQAVLETGRHRILFLAPDVPRAQRPRILHVEDDVDLSQVIEMALANHAEVVSAPTLQSAEDHLRREEFSLIVLDLGLPDGSGLSLLDRLEDLAPRPIPVVILSVSDVPQAIKERVAATFVKSRFSEMEVVRTVLALVTTRSDASTLRRGVELLR